jgi:hypothetical protein
MRGRQHAEHLDPAPVHTCFLRCLAKCGVSEVMITIFSGTPWKGDLAGVRTHPGRSLHEHDLRTVRTVTDQDQHSGGTRPDSWPERNYSVQPRLLRQGNGEVREPCWSLHVRVGHGVTPRC